MNGTYDISPKVISHQDKRNYAKIRDEKIEQQGSDRKIDYNSDHPLVKLLNSGKGDIKRK